MTRTDRLNRVVLTGLGLLLVAGGVLGLVRSLFGFGAAAARDRLLSPPERLWVHHHAGWFWLVVALLSLLLAIGCLRWLVAQLRSERIGMLVVGSDASAGRTRLSASAVADAVTSDVSAYPGVARASARLVHDPGRPDVLLTVALTENADLIAVRRQVETEAVPRLRQAVGLELPVQVRLQVPAAPARLVE